MENQNQNQSGNKLKIDDKEYLIESLYLMKQNNLLLD